MKPPVVGDEYAHGQMMGMLVMIQMLENARDDNAPVKMSTIRRIKSVAVESLAQYLQKPEEDVILLVDQQLRSV